MVAYRTALMGLSGRAGSRRSACAATPPGTINALVVSYYRSDAWRDLEPETRKTRSRTIERFRERHGDKRVAMLRRQHVVEMLDEIEGRSARRAGSRRSVRCCSTPCRPMLRDDPTLGIATPKLPKSKGHHLDRRRDRALSRALAVRDATEARLRVRLGGCVTARRSRAARPQHVSTGPGRRAVDQHRPHPRLETSEHPHLAGAVWR